MFWGSFESSNLSVSGLLPSKYYCFLCGMGSLPSNYHLIKKVANCLQSTGTLPSKFILALCLQNLLLLCGLPELSFNNESRILPNKYGHTAFKISISIISVKFLIAYCLQSLYNYTACIQYLALYFHW